MYAREHLYKPGLFSFVQGWNKPGFIPGFFPYRKKYFCPEASWKNGNKLKHDGMVILLALKWGFDAVSESMPRTAHVRNGFFQFIPRFVHCPR